MPCGEILIFNVADLSVMPLPEKALISGKRACNWLSKFDASFIWYFSISPFAFGIEITIVCFDALPTIANRSFFKELKSRSNNLKFVGNDFLATALSVTSLALLVCA